MFGSIVLEVFIGLFFLYLVLSLITTAVQEAVAAAFKMRAATLTKGVRQLLQDNVDPGFARALMAALYAHPALRRLYSGKSPAEGGVLMGRGPSYLPGDSFAVALLDSIRRLRANESAAVRPVSAEDLFSNAGKIVEMLPDGELKTKLTLIVGDVASPDRRVQRRGEQVKKAIEDWFDQSMDRVSGWYKRKAQYFGIAIGFIIAVLLNADTVTVAGRLWSSQSLRSSMAAAAEAALAERGDLAAGATGSAAAATATAGATAGDLDKLLALARLAPIGWRDLTQEREAPPPQAPPSILGRFALQPGQTWMLAIVGWLATGFAISLGAAFWFDALGRLMRLRASGRPPPAGVKAP